jgi:exonuclease VII large subunit
MENTIEIQKEFEILVSELERLKSINELTSSNADSAKYVVNEIDKFVKSVVNFKTEIDKDLKEKTSKIDLILKQLDATVLSIESNTKKSVNDHSQKLKELHEKSDSVMNQNKDALSKELNKFAETLFNLSESISSTIGNSTAKIIEKIQEKNSQTKSELSNVSGQINKNISSVETNFNTKFKDLNEQLGQNMKLSKQNRIFLLVSSIVTIGLLIALFLK